MKIKFEIKTNICYTISIKLRFMYYKYKPFFGVIIINIFENKLIVILFKMFKEVEATESSYIIPGVFIIVLSMCNKI